MQDNVRGFKSENKRQDEKSSPQIFLKELIATAQSESTQKQLAIQDPTLSSVALQRGRGAFYIYKLGALSIDIGFWQNFWSWLLFVCASYLNSRAAYEVIPKNFFLGRALLAAFVSITLVFICKEAMSHVLIRYQLKQEAETTQEYLNTNITAADAYPITQKQHQGMVSGFQEIQADDLKENHLQTPLLLAIAALLTVEAVAIISNGLENKENWFILLGTPILAICFSLGCGWYKAHFIAHPKHLKKLSMAALNHLEAINIDNLNHQIEQANQVTQSIFNRENPQNREQEQLRKDIQAKSQIKNLRLELEKQLQHVLEEIENAQKLLLDKVQECETNPDPLGGSRKIKQLTYQLAHLDYDKERRSLTVINQYLATLADIDCQYDCHDKGFFKVIEQDLVNRRDSAQQRLEQLHKKLQDFPNSEQ